MPAGRPSKYTPELQEQAWQYVDGGWKDCDIDGIAPVIPSHEGLAIHLGISRTCMYDWITHEDKEEFSNTLETINIKQKQILLTQGLNNTFNSNITKLALGNHGMHEKQDTKHSGVMGFQDLSGKSEEELEAIVHGDD